MEKILKEVSKAKFICLETYKKSGEAVRTPVWFTIEKDLVYFHTPANSGKVKRIRRNPNIRIAPCTRSGKITGEWLKGVARELDKEESKKIVKLVNSRLGFLDKIISFFICRLYGERIAFEIKIEEN